METLMDFSLVASAFETLCITPPSKLILLEAQTLSSAHVPPFPPDTSALTVGFDSLEVALQIKTVLLTVYRREHKVFLVTAKNDSVSLSLSDFANEKSFEPFICFYVPAFIEGSSFESFQEIVAHLRAPNGCPWDREQTHESLRKHLLEEAYEVYDALADGPTPALAEELGDLLLQVILHAQLAAEAGVFDLADVQAALATKIVRRHPHVFGTAVAETAGDVNRQWERIKADERAGAAGADPDAPSRKGALDGIGRSLPALAASQEMQERAAALGYDWPTVDGLLAKLHEELGELLAAESGPERAEELGDLLMVVVNYGRRQGVEAEAALRFANDKFKRRFGSVERQAAEREVALRDLDFNELDALWAQAKIEERQEKSQ